MKKFFAFIFGAATLWGNAAEAPDYYLSCEGKTGQSLLVALKGVVSSHTKVSYDGLWAVYKTSDVRPDGTLWDIYSTKAWPSNFPQCGNYKNVGDCVNREHSFPKSWWGGGNQTQYSDAYHLYPTDGKVNGQRSNYPFGECEGGEVLASNGNVKPLGRCGDSTFPGFSGKVFEPDDQYKGDLARSYFYLAAAYNDNIARWTSDHGSDMLAGNSFPVFKTWALNLLLKWHRQDPVSEKEINRNEAISKFQKNRNPFIDHPELVEYIWGNKQGLAWYIGAGNEPTIVTPADGSTINIGTSSIGITRSMQVNVKGTDLTENVSVNVTGAGFTVAPSTLQASTVNAAAGATVTVSYKSATAATATGSLILRSGDVTTTCTLTAKAVDGLPAGPATSISDESFVATWSCIDSTTANYTLNVMRDGTSIAGYPRTVTAGDESALVEGLEPETTYTYTVASTTLVSAPVTVITAAPIPSVDFLYDGELSFITTPGVSSDIAEVLVLIENIPGNVTVSVESPFQVSSDKQNWGTSVVLTPGEERFYMRLYGMTTGEFTTSLVAKADGYFNDDVDVDGVISNNLVTFHEDFEADGAASYGKKTYNGTACTWETDGYFEKNGSNSYPHTGDQAVRMNKNAAGYLMMLESKPNGIGTVSFWARQWSGENKDLEIEVLVSDNQGSTWEPVGKVEVKPTNGTNVYTEYVVPVNRTGNLRVKLQQNITARTMIDDFSLTDCRSSSIEEANTAEYHSWDAYCRNGALIMESDGTSEDFATVYSVDGTERFAGLLPAGETSLTLTPGLYIVVVRDFSRRVVVK